tara:strand:- start:272 stop:529 length:258 start_codon:yes stop_codon:yes gene_type:complete
MKNTKIEALKQLMDIKEYDSIRGRALAHVSSKQFRAYQDEISWNEKSPTFGLEQEQIDQVIAGCKREIEMLDYMYNLILYDKYDS